ncbi:uncharacterized protein BJ212DRAFT_1526021 [Suillus subaureus]|uniref:Uncharacterized protein n=1 Tax=Suillus subaureus TaxID=48587 RepID=A0A9P7E545_9AGAM|nr:uncharacterized protein BJ212DRAFT_1526021 [Suillus subaureus]KAG1810932.1 hypothetical protein BJ212DRAFT_1526021 [Suillus subaureus]
MQTEYSADDIEAATSLQFFAWRFLLVSHWNTMKGLYIVTRYLPFLLLATNLYLSFIPNETPGKCRVLDNICLGFGILSVICSEGISFLPRTIFRPQNIILLAAVLSTYLLVVDASARLLPEHPSALPSPPLLPQHMRLARSRASQGATRVRPVSDSSYRLFSFPYSNWNWRTNQGPLYVVLVKHNIFYYTCGFLFSVANIFTSLLLHYSYHAILDDFQFVILATLATRMHRRLWQMKPQTYSSDALMPIPMSEMSPVEHTA